MTKTTFAILCQQGDALYQINRVGAGPVGAVNPFTGKPDAPRTWKTRRGAERYADRIRGGNWDAVEVVEA